MSVDVDPDVADLLAATVTEVVRRAVAPAAASADAVGALPADVVAALAAAGLLDLPADPALLATVARPLAAASASAALLCVAATAAHACAPPGEPVAGRSVAFVDAGPAVIAALGAGVPTGWVLSGEAAADWVGGAGAAEVIVVVAAVGEGGELAFAVDRAAPGLTVGAERPGTGLRGSGRAILRLEGAPARLVGGAAAVTVARRLWLLGLGAAAIGVAQAALDLTSAHLQQRRQFRTPLSQFPALRALVGSLDRDLAIAEAALAAATGDDGLTPGAARTAAETAVRVTGEAIQLHGGYGYIVETGVERLFRDALSLRARILGATDPSGAARLEARLGPA